ncbi:MAG: response regulator [Chloroflexota bacterium]|nr:response regulator [Chloroflexota bacterium]
MTLNIVHLEDEKDLAEGLAFIIQEEAPGVTLYQFASSDDVVAHIDQHWQTTDLYILDVRVPGQMNGLGVAEYIRARGSQAVIVVTSAYDPPKQEIINALQIHYFRKPWDLPDNVIEMLNLVDQ